MSASLAFQTHARALLVADAGLIALVPADNIVDANGRPEVSPRIVLGDDQELPADEVVGRYTKLAATLHVWVKEPGLVQTKTIAGRLRRILSGQRWTLDDYRCMDTRFQSARFLRDPDGETTHGVVTFEATIEEL
jgi:hypothetical protein